MVYLDYSDKNMMAAYWKLPDRFKYGRQKQRPVREVLNCTDCLREIERQKAKNGYCWYEPISAVSVNWTTGEPTCANHMPERQAAIRAILSQWAGQSYEYSVGYYWYLRIFYTIKCLICILLNRESPDEIGVRGYFDHVESVGMFGWQDESGFEAPSWAGSWSDVQVGRGIFKNWHYRISWDSNW